MELGLALLLRRGAGCAEARRDTEQHAAILAGLRAHPDRVRPAQADLCRDFFRRAVALELSFFEAACAERT